MRSLLSSGRLVALLLLAGLFACGGSQASARDRAATPARELVRLPPPELRGHISVLKPPGRGHWVSLIVQECLLEAAIAEISIRDASGRWALDHAPTGVLQWRNSAQTQWIALPDADGDYTFLAAVFRSASGRVLFDSRDPDNRGKYPGP